MAFSHYTNSINAPGDEIFFVKSPWEQRTKSVTNLPSDMEPEMSILLHPSLQNIECQINYSKR